MPKQVHICAFGDADWRHAFSVEVDDFLALVRAVLPQMRQAGGGPFEHLGSGGELAWAVRDDLSIIPKAANEAMVRGLEGGYGIRANSVMVGVIGAGMYLILKLA